MENKTKEKLQEVIDLINQSAKYREQEEKLLFKAWRVLSKLAEQKK